MAMIAAAAVASDILLQARWRHEPNKNKKASIR